VVQLDCTPASAAIYFPKTVPRIAQPQHAVLGIVTFAAVGAGNKAANVRALAIEIFGNGKAGAATARDEEHAGVLLLFLTLLGRALLQSTLFDSNHRSLFALVQLQALFPQAQ
jgi:hypothetical protein